MKKTKILIIDDSPTVRASLRQMLPNSTEVSEAADGVEGLKQVQANPPNLILLDCQMPKMDGIEVYRRLQSHAHFRRIPVVIMSANREEVVPLLNRLPMDYEFLSKPFTQDQLLRSSHEAMKRARQIGAQAEAGEHRWRAQGRSPQPRAASTQTAPAQTAPAATAWSNQRLQTEVQRLQNKNATLEQEVQQLRQQLKQIVQTMHTPTPA